MGVGWIQMKGGRNQSKKSPLSGHIFDPEACNSLVRSTQLQATGFMTRKGPAMPVPECSVALTHED